MPTPRKGARLGGSPAHQRLILSNLATALFEHGRITTTEAKARVLRPVAEKLITKAKKGDIHNRRLVVQTIRDKGVVHKLFTEIGPHFAERPGGYTRITKIGPRKGDNAPLAVIELVEEEAAATPSRRRRVRRAPAPARRAQPKADAEAAAAESAAADEAAPAEDTVAADTEAEDTEAQDTEAQDAATEDSAEQEPDEAESDAEDTAERN